MNDFEKICNTYNLEEEKVESDMYSLLARIAGVSPEIIIKDNNYRLDITYYLSKKGFIDINIVPNEITELGLDRLKEGWIAKNFEPIKEKEQNELREKRKKSLFAILGRIIDIWVSRI